MSGVEVSVELLSTNTSTPRALSARSNITSLNTAADQKPADTPAVKCAYSRLVPKSPTPPTLECDAPIARRATRWSQGNSTCS